MLSTLRVFGKGAESFLLPDRVSVKVIFDNVRNSLIASTLVTGGFWVARFASRPQVKGAGGETETFLVMLSQGLVWLGFVLMALNLLQIIAISTQGRTMFSPTTSTENAERRSASGLAQVIALVLVTAILLLIQLCAIAVFSLAVLRGIADAP